MNWLLAALLCVLLVESVRRMPFGAVAGQLTRAGGRAVRVVGSRRISDHWKEKAMGAYARATFGATGRLALLIAAVLALAGGFILIADALGAPDFAGFLLGWQGLLFTLVAASLYAWGRARLARRGAGAAADSAYGAGAQFLHQFALGNTRVAEASFALDQRLARPDTAATAQGAHVFVTGLARAGTTVLMRRLHASGAFRSLTYADMPFVLAPNLWRVLGGGRRRGQATERAHGDDLLVSTDSPESLDEVFWRVFAGDRYITRTALAPHDTDPGLRARFVAYVGAILARSGKTRYLSKNNNNILRLGTLRAAFPNALILIPFRDPLAHAGSLLAQHRRFTAMQADDPFVRSYMDWLAHHEFGPGHRPFRFADAAPEGDPDTPDYWVRLWMQTYGWLLEHAPDDVVFVSYEALCADPAVWEKIADRAGIDPDTTADGGFRAAAPKAIALADPDLGAEARALYERLAARAI